MVKRSRSDSSSSDDSNQNSDSSSSDGSSSETETPSFREPKIVSEQNNPEKHSEKHLEKNLEKRPEKSKQKISLKKEGEKEKTKKQTFTCSSSSEDSENENERQQREVKHQEKEKARAAASGVEQESKKRKGEKKKRKGEMKESNNQAEKRLSIPVIDKPIKRLSESTPAAHANIKVPGTPTGSIDTMIGAVAVLPDASQLLCEVVCGLADSLTEIAISISTKSGFTWKPKILVEKEKRSRKAKDPNVPKRPQTSAYSVWCDHMRKKYPEKPLRLTELGEMWQKVTDKSVWEQVAKERKDDFRIQQEACRVPASNTRDEIANNAS